VIIFDFCNSGPIELNAVPSQPPRKTVLCYWRPRTIARLCNSSSNDVFYRRSFVHMTSLPLEELKSVLQ
jgi:hypothetical protein